MHMHVLMRSLSHFANVLHCNISVLSSASVFCFIVAVVVFIVVVFQRLASVTVCCNCFSAILKIIVEKMRVICAICLLVLVFDIPIFHTKHSCVVCVFTSSVCCNASLFHLTIFSVVR